MAENHDVYWKIEASERHFNNIQAGIRGVASGWLLSAFGAIAVVIQKSNSVEWWIQPDLIIMTICAMASLGLLILWIMDQLVYHRLLNSFFLLGLKYEYDHPDIPPVHTAMILSSDNRGMSRLLKLYYLIPIVALGLIAFTFFFVSYDPEFNLKLLSILIVIIPLVLVVWIFNESDRIPFDRLISSFEDDGFIEIIREQKYEQVFANHHKYRTGKSGHV